MKVRELRTPKGTRYWQMDYRVHGQRRRETVKGARSMREARALAEVKWGEIRQREQRGEPGPRSAQWAVTIEALLELDAERPGIAPATRAQHREKQARLLEHLPGGLPVAALTVGHIDAYKRARTDGERAVSNRTVNLELSILRAAIRRAVKAKRLAHEPCEIEMLPQDKGGRRFLTLAQVRAMVRVCRERERAAAADLEAADTDKARRGAAGRLEVARETGDIIAFFAGTGLRLSELFRMRWRDVDLEAGTIQVRGKRGRSPIQRVETLPLSEGAQEILRRRGPGAHEALVFGIDPAARRRGAKGQHQGVVYLHPTRLRRRLKEVAKSAGVGWWRDVRIHDLRHAHAMAALEAGASIRDVAALLRHRSTTLTVSTYLHEDMARMRETVGRIDPEGSAGGAGPRPGGAKVVDIVPDDAAEA